MKKIIAIALTLVMLFGAVTVFADTKLVTPSKTTEGMTSFEVTVEHPVDGVVVTLLPIEADTTDAGEKAMLDIADKELEKAQAAGTVEKYFGEEAAKAIAEILGENAEMSVDEFLAVVLANYEESMGAVNVVAKLATPYEKDEKVAALVGLVSDDVVAWTVIEGVGLEDGSVQFAMDAATAKAVAEGNALFAICSK